MFCKKINLLLYAAVLFAFSFCMTGCFSSGDDKELQKKERRKNMTPEELENDIALERAKERFKDNTPLPTTPQEKRSIRKKTAKKEGGWFNFTPHSKAKRQQMYDMSRPLVMEGETDPVMPWKSGSQSNRSESLHESHLDRLR